MFFLFLFLTALSSDPEKIEDEQAEQRLCARYANYEVTVPENYDAEQEARELAEMFANGDEVEQDFGAAIYFICNGGGFAAVERWGMLEHVLAMKRGETDEPLDFCNFATSRDGGIICAARRDEEEGPAFDARYAAVRKKHGPALDALRKRADSFIEADAFWEAEQSRGGTMYAYAETHAVLDRRGKFIELLERYAAQRAPAASQAALERADAKLNTTYRKRLAAIQPCDPEYESCAPPSETDNLRAAQRAWISYRDAWIAWYQSRWRGAATPDALRREIATVITNVRIEEVAVP